MTTPYEIRLYKLRYLEIAEALSKVGDKIGVAAMIRCAQYFETEALILEQEDSEMIEEIVSALEYVG